MQLGNCYDNKDYEKKPENKRSNLTRLKISWDLKS